MAGLENGHMLGRTTRIPALGPRGEGWVLIQTTLLAGLVLAGLEGARWPERLQGPALVIAIVAGAAGLGLAAAAIATLGRSVSPFPKPPATSELKASGGYALARHPIDGGVLLVSLAWSLGRSPGRSSRPPRSPSPWGSSPIWRSDG
jgi:protein-S-isoprenylcysteine O-methyltransferase Ste14